MWLVRLSCSVLVFFCLILQISPAIAQEVTFTTWQSNADTRWSHNASQLSAYLGNPTSELQYENIDSKVVEIAFTHPFRSDSLHFVIGGGTVGEGVLVDDDYVSAAGATYYGATVSGAHRISRTNSDIRGSGLYYVNAEYHPAGLIFDIAGAPVQVYAGVQYWYENYIAQGVYQVECTDSTGPPTFCNPVGFSGYTNQAVITNKLSWSTIYVGVRSRFALSQDMSLGFLLNYSPITYLSNEDVHHLRSDLHQDPSFSMSGFGQAIDLQLDWRYQFLEGAELRIGYRYWDRKVTNGDWYSYSSSGVSHAPLLEMHTTRKGLTLGLSVIF